MTATGTVTNMNPTATVEAKQNCLYLIGSLRNERIPILANRLREENPHMEVFDEWYSAGPHADDTWKAHQLQKGLTYQEALQGHAARNVFAFDKRHIDRSTHALLVLPAGKSGHMEIMYATYGAGLKTAILLDPEDVRWDVMYQFVPTILNNDEEITPWLQSTSQDQCQDIQNSTSLHSILLNDPFLIGDIKCSIPPTKTRRKN